MRTLPLLALAACTPLTQYRQSLMVANPEPPAALGAAMRPGEAALGAGFTQYPVVLQDLAPEVGDPGVLYPANGAEAHARVGVVPGLEVGAEVAWASGADAQPSALGVLDVPGNHGAWGVGTHVVAGPRGERWGAGVTVDAMWMSLPFARYTYVGPEPGLGAYAPGDAAELYALSATGAVHPIRIRAAASVQGNVGPVEGVAALAVCPVFTNVGFSDTEEKVFTSGGLAVMPTLRVAADLGPVYLYGQGWVGMGGYAAASGGRLGAEVRFGGGRWDRDSEVHHPLPDDSAEGSLVGK